MIKRILTRRLERLEEVIMPDTVRRVWQIVYVDSDGSRREGEKIEWKRPCRSAVPLKRVTRRETK